MNSSDNTKYMTQISIFISLIVVLQSLGYVISNCTPLSFSISLVFIPIILGGFLFGVKGGSVLGLSFGIVTSIACIIGIDRGGYILFNANPFFTVFLCLLKGTMGGFVPALIFHKLKLQKLFKTILCSIIGPFTNTLIFVVSMLTVYKDILYEWAGNTNILKYVIIGLIGVNFLIEEISTVVITPVVYNRICIQLNKK